MLMTGITAATHAALPATPAGEAEGADRDHTGRQCDDVVARLDVTVRSDNLAPTGAASALPRGDRRIDTGLAA